MSCCVRASTSSKSTSGSSLRFPEQIIKMSQFPRQRAEGEMTEGVGADIRRSMSSMISEAS